MPRGCVSPLLPPRALQFQYAQFSFFPPARCSGGGGGRGRREGDGGDFLSEFWRMGAQPNAERDRELSKPSKNLILDVRSSSTPNIEEVSSVHTAGSHGFEEAVEFKPVEHPSEPIVYDQPIACPLPEPSIINDGRIWKQRRTSTARRAKADLPVVKDASALESRDGSKPTPNPAKLHISSSLSAPEYSIISLLEECNSFQDRLQLCRNAPLQLLAYILFFALYLQSIVFMNFVVKYLFYIASELTLFFLIISIQVL